MYGFYLPQLGGSDGESDSDNKDSDEDGTNDKNTKKDDKKKGVYIPPKLAAVYYGSYSSIICK